MKSYMSELVQTVNLSRAGLLYSFLFSWKKSPSCGVWVTYFQDWSTLGATEVSAAKNKKSSLSSKMFKFTVPEQVRGLIFLDPDQYPLS